MSPPRRDPVGFADLQTHSLFSDGTATPQSFVDRMQFLRTAAPAEIWGTVYTGEVEYATYRGNLSQQNQLTRYAEQAAYVGNNLRVVALTDHDTVLGLEPYLDALPENLDFAFIGGTEITTYAPLDGGVNLGLHLLAYFSLRGASSKTPYDLRTLRNEERVNFFHVLLRDYVPLLNELANGLHVRYGTLMRERINATLPPEKHLTLMQLEEIAAERLTPYHSALEQTVIMRRDHPSVIAHTDVAQALVRTNLAPALDSALEYVGRRGPYYVPFDAPWPKQDIHAVAAQLRAISARSPVDVRLSLAHPFTYVRALERKAHKEWDRAYAKMDTLITELVTDQHIDAIEALYPRYHRNFVDAIRRNDSFNALVASRLREERKLAKDAQQHFISLAEKLGLRITGGSDYHGEPDTRLPGIGNGELMVPAHLVGSLFADSPKSEAHSTEASVRISSS